MKLKTRPGYLSRLGASLLVSVVALTAAACSSSEAGPTTEPAEGTRVVSHEFGETSVQATSGELFPSTNTPHSVSLPSASPLMWSSRRGDRRSARTSWRQRVPRWSRCRRSVHPRSSRSSPRIPDWSSSRRWAIGATTTPRIDRPHSAGPGRHHSVAWESCLLRTRF